MKLAILDIGNSAIKLRVCSRSEDIFSASFPTVGDALVKAEETGAEAGIYCCTGRLTESDANALKQKGWKKFDCNCALPVEIKYTTPDTLGPDRLAAAVGAYGRYPDRALMIADAGTALTIDVVTSGGEFLGGNISPGLHLRAESLHDHTSRIPLVSLKKDVASFGTDTETALQAGILWGMVWEIAGAFREAERNYKCDAILLTGGDASYLEDKIEKAVEEGVEIDYVSSLVTEGLKYAYFYNHDKKD